MILCRHSDIERQVDLPAYRGEPVAYETRNVDTELHWFGDSSGAAFVELRRYDALHGGRRLLSCSALLDARTGERVMGATK